MKYMGQLSKIMQSCGGDPQPNRDNWCNYGEDKAKQKTEAGKGANPLDCDGKGISDA
jgi:hypothetical protein